jgi:Carboxypeptidase regulatory-like domain
MLAAQPPNASAPARPPAPPAAPAQPPATGSVSGHVVLGDSRLPARMATVNLLPAGKADAGDAKPTASEAQVQTGLDGGFVIPNVLPGAYYVVAQKLGYVVPVTMLYSDPDNYERAPKDVKDALAAAYPPVAVAANRMTTIDIVLNKGAVIAGTVRFDDGAPDSGAMVSVLRKDQSGKWAEFATQETYGSGAPTDDQGDFRLTGLPAGEYLLRTTLALAGADVKSPGAVSTNEPDYRWDVYFGDGIRPRDAKTIKLRDAEETHGNNIEIPLAKLHAVSGTVISMETGAPINSARIELHNADDDSLDAETVITSVGGQFRFPYIAEGEYTIKVTHAGDVVQAKPDCDRCQPRSSDEKIIRTYAAASQPLVVKGETSGIIIHVKPQPPDAATTAQ